MGTTVTPNLGLIKPDLAESIKENLPTFAGWADQNADNMDAIDALFRATSSHTWTPTITASGGGFALGATGFVEGKYLRFHPRMVMAYFRFYMGAAGFAAGTGGYSIPVPVAIASELDTFNNEIPIGKCLLLDATASVNGDAMEVMYSTSADNIFFRPPAGGSWSGVAPFTLAQQDRVSGFFMYPTSVA